MAEVLVHRLLEVISSSLLHLMLIKVQDPEIKIVMFSINTKHSTFNNIIFSLNSCCLLDLTAKYSFTQINSLLLTMPAVLCKSLRFRSTFTSVLTSLMDMWTSFPNTSFTFNLIRRTLSIRRFFEASLTFRFISFKSLSIVWCNT